MLMPEERKTVNPGLSAILSFLVTGMGQIYNGQIKKGLCLISLSIGSILLILVGAIFIGYWCLVRGLGPVELILGLILMVVGVIALAILGIYNIYDAYNVARKKLAE